jgi:hypothetical protein
MTMTMSVKRDKTGLRRYSVQAKRLVAILLFALQRRKENREAQGGRRAAGTGCVSPGEATIEYLIPSQHSRHLVVAVMRTSGGRVASGCCSICDQETLMNGAASTPDSPASLKAAKL